MFKPLQIIKDFRAYRNAIKCAVGQKVHIQNSTSVSSVRHVGRILRILQTLQKAGIAKTVRDNLEVEFIQRKAALAAIGIVLPDNIEGIQDKFNELMRVN